MNLKEQIILVFYSLYLNCYYFNQTFYLYLWIFWIYFHFFKDHLSINHSKNLLSLFHLSFCFFNYLCLHSVLPVVLFLFPSVSVCFYLSVCLTFLSEHFARWNMSEENVPDDSYSEFVHWKLYLYWSLITFRKYRFFANTLRNKSCTLVKCKKETFLISLNWRRKQEMNQDVVFYLKSYSFYLFKRNMFSKLFEFQFKVSIIVTKYIYLIPSFEVCKRRKHFKMEFLKNFPF